MSSDGRLCEFDETGQELTVRNEEIKKVWKMNNSVLVGIAGSASILIEVIEYLRSFEHLENLDIGNIVKKVQKLVKNQYKGDIKSLIFIGGKNLNGGYELNILSSENHFEIERNEPIPNSILAYAFFPKNVDKEEMMSKYIYVPFASGEFINTDKIRFSLEACINKIAETELSVNNKIYNEIIEN
jgi:hypothetical protein